MNRERLAAQLVEIDRLNEELAPFRILRGMEVDILEDGGLDLDEDMLERLDVVVASVHSKLAMERPKMTERMVRAVASPHVDILGHCTGRLIGKRQQSTFDADYVFAACAQFGTAVEINCRPERLDPPKSCSHSPSRPAAGSRSTPMPMPLASSSGSRTGAKSCRQRRAARPGDQHVGVDDLLAWAATRRGGLTPSGERVYGPRMRLSCVQDRPHLAHAGASRTMDQNADLVSSRGQW